MITINKQHTMPGQWKTSWIQDGISVEASTDFEKAVALHSALIESGASSIKTVRLQRQMKASSYKCILLALLEKHIGIQKHYRDNAIANRCYLQAGIHDQKILMLSEISAELLDMDIMYEQVQR